MRILINIVVIIFDYKIKIKNDETFTEAFNETHEIFNENYVKFNNSQDEIKIDQNSVFLSANTIIAEKTIFVLNAVFQIIQLETVNSLLISIKHL